MHSEVDGVSGANQYSVRPLALVSTVTSPTLAVFRMIPPAAAAGSPPAPATAMPNRTRAATETAPTVPTTSDTTARIPVSIRGLGRAGAVASSASAITAASASVAKAATSMRPAAIPALVRISL